MSSYKLVYFNGKGLAETIRYIFAYLNIKYEDYRYPIEVIDGNYIKNEFENDKNNNMFIRSFNKLPYLEVKEEDKMTIISQSKSIERYLAKKYNLFGKNINEETLIDSICETIRDIKDNYYKTKDIKILEENLLNLAKMLNSTSECMGNKLCVGENITLADISLYQFISDNINTIEGTKINISIPYKIRNIMLILDENENIKAWRNNRPITMF